jgi:transposase
MSRGLRADYTKRFLFPPAIEDWVGPTDTARFVRSFVDTLDLSEIAGEEWVEASEDPNGRPHYAFDLLLKAWLYGYIYNIRSTRKLEQACRQMVPLIWLTGMYEPDHNTLWRFWHRYRSALKKVFVKSVRVALEANMVGTVLQAIDGTKIASASSQHTAWHRDDLKKTLAAVNERLEKLEAEIAAAQDAAQPDDRLPTQLQEETQLRKAVQEAIERLDKADADHLHQHDPEARMMKGGRSRRIEFGYNAQVVCDASHGIIVAENVVTEANDERQLGPMLTQVEENVGSIAEVTLTDAGYDTAESLAKAEELEATVLTAPRAALDKAGPYHLSRFTFNEEQGTVHCPIGQELRYVNVTRHRDKPHPLMIYRCDVWKTCPVGRICSKSQSRVVEIGPHHAARQRHREKMANPDNRKSLKRRGEIIERVFGQIKGNDGFRRWLVRGEAKVAAQWTMICTALNLRKIIGTLAQQAPARA